MNQIALNIFAAMIGLTISSLFGFIIAYSITKSFGLPFDTNKTIMFITIISCTVFIHIILKEILNYYGFSTQILIFFNIFVVIVGSLFLLLFCRKKK